ncbi:MFS transporter [Paraburkholderia acidisoli]|uniref:MFS transporter n=1 Tax=Paraburkholderia acidisoli TaxID=2571748 RepID=A0A7Z2GK59_9BURK|nr:MFS transporter [Paraburkholderia acidisoli]QGZ63318.1 MFS transporter [Paraburkholderia acidisoli]
MAERASVRGELPVGRMTYTEFLDACPMNGFLWMLLLGCIVAQILDGFDFQSTSFALPLIVREFHISTTQAGAIGSVTNIGLLLGALLFAPLADRVGRRPIFQWALFAYAFGTFLSAIAPSYPVLLLARFIAGMGIAAEFPVAFALLAEYAPKRLRHIFIGSGAIGYSFGWFVCAVAATLIVPRFGWRALFWVGVSPALMILYVRRYMPESVRFLLQQGRVDEAAQIVRRLADRAGYTSLELVPPEAAAYAKKTRPTLGQQFSLLKFSALAIAVLGLFQLANNVQVVGFGTWLPSIFLRQGFTLTKSFTFTMIVLATTPLGQIFGMWLQDRMPRKWAMLLLSGLSALCFFGFGLSFEYRYPVEIIVACDVGYQFFSGGVVPIFYTLSSELFPTRVRSLAMGLVVACARVGSITGPFVLGWLLTLGTMIHQIIYYFTMPLVLAAVVLVVAVKVDSRQKTLEDASGEPTEETPAPVAARMKPGHAPH